ncbi:FAD-dependent monooxygenase [Actinoplanes sp. NPDC049596]|uniref:FAD-dependent monooxygenase n=1 Tax=unclassified Actinoplanes TaxID=2626549 RepID=UPI00342DFE08
MFTESKFTVIVGAGPTGLTLARVLQRHGVPFRILDKSPKLFDGSRGKGLQPRTLEVLDDLGLADRFLATGGAYPPLLIHLPGGDTMTRHMDEPRDPTPAVPWPNGLMQPQWRTSELLAEGVPVELGAGVTALTQDEDGVRVTLDTGETIAARYVVGADGGRSTVRKALGVPFEGDTFETEQLVVADVRVRGLDRDNWHIWPGEGRTVRLGLCPLPGTDDYQLTTSMVGESLEDLVASAGLELVHVGWRSLYRPNIRMVSRYRAGDVFLAGDAAHVHPPTGGQGLNTGIQDAYNLGWKIAVGSDKLLDTYEEERLPVAAGVLGISTRLHRTASMRRDDPELRQLSLNYRDSSLSQDHRATPGLVQAGDRAPGPIFDLLRGPRFTLLAFAWTGDLPAGAHRIDDPAILDIYDVHEPTLFLVRPDNYIGCVSSSPDDIERYRSLLGV